MIRPANRPKVSAFLALSLDGYIAGPSGDLSWLEAYGRDSVEETGYQRLFDDIDTLVMGRNTHEKVLTFGYWPYVGKRVVVLTHRPFIPVNGEIAQDAPLPEVLAYLDSLGSRHVYLDGGHVVRQGIRTGLVDEITLSWVPMVLGGGIRLFDGPLGASHWSVRELRRLPSGVVQVVYGDPILGLSAAGKEAIRATT